MKTIIAIGGDEIGKLKKDGSPKSVLTETAHREVIARTGKKHPQVLYIPTAKDDSEEYIAAFQKYYKNLGCSNVDVLRLIREKPSKKVIASKIFSANAIYVNGGDTFRMIEIWKRNGIDVMLKKAYLKGIVMAGHSAGAICWFTDGDSDSFGKKCDFKITALGIVNALLCPHYDTDRFRQTGLKKIMKRTPHIIAIALDECSTIEIVDDKYRIIAATSRNKARRTYWEKGKYIIEEIKITKDFQDLKPLLTKSI